MVGTSHALHHSGRAQPSFLGGSVTIFLRLGRSSRCLRRPLLLQWLRSGNRLSGRKCSLLRSVTYRSRVAGRATRSRWMGISPTAIASRSMANVRRKLGPLTGQLVHEAPASSSAHGLCRERFSQPDLSHRTWPVHIDRALELQAPTPLTHGNFSNGVLAVHFPKPGYVLNLTTRWAPTPKAWHSPLSQACRSETVRLR